MESIRRPSIYQPRNVIFLDEVHNLSTKRMDQFLVVLERADLQAVVMFATTKPHKIAPEIKTRLKSIRFVPIAFPLILDHIGHICRSENLNYDVGSLRLIAKYAAGSVRAAVTELETTLSVSGAITEDAVRRRLLEGTDRAVAAALTAMTLEQFDEAAEALHLDINAPDVLRGLIQATLLDVFLCDVQNRRTSAGGATLTDVQRATVRVAISERARANGLPEADVWRPLIKYWDPQPDIDRTALLAKVDGFIALLGPING